MANRALFLVLCMLSYRLVIGQYCQDLPPRSRIEQEFADQLGASDQTTTTELYHNCIAYDETSRNFKETTVTLQYTMGSSVISTQASYVCGEAVPGGGNYQWAIGTVMPDTGTTTNETGCRNCKSATLTTCTPCTPCQNGRAGIYCDCICNPGFTGSSNCMDIDECQSGNQVCDGGGVCANNMGSFTCTCPDPCTAGDCNGCCSNPCTRGGTCTSTAPDIFTCDCPPAFTGQTCSEFVGGCYSSPCMNGGQCSIVFDPNNPLAYRCQCPLPFSGVNCETRIDFCADQPCLNSGWCTSESNRFTCTCLQGFTGNDCSQNLQSCAADPSVCGNNGMCRSRTVGSVIAYFCSCYPGYTGELCDQTISTCLNANDPCFHNGACQFSNLGNVSFDCTCIPEGNWGGFYCADCQLQPIQCVNGVPNYQCIGNRSCICNGAWTGEACDICSGVYERGSCKPDCTLPTYSRVESTNLCYACGISNCTACDVGDNRCTGCERDFTISNTRCVPVTQVGTNEDDNTGETIGIVLGCIAGAVVILIFVFAMLLVALRYIKKDRHKVNQPAGVQQKPAEMTGFFTRASTLFSSGGHTGGIKKGTDSSFPSYKEMVNEYDKPAEDNEDHANKDVVTSPPADDEWLPPPDD